MGGPQPNMKGVFIRRERDTSDASMQRKGHMRTHREGGCLKAE